LFHVLLFISSFYLFNQGFIYQFFLVGQITFYAFALIGSRTKIKLFFLPYYYSMTLLSQIKGIISEISGSIKPYWEKADSTR
jgi:hypothetical protein